MGKKNAVWITGASSGIGKSLSIKFAENNFNVIASARRIKSIQQTITENNFTSEFIPLQNDVSNYADLTKKINELQENYHISCLINNAGITSFKPFVENTKEEIDQIINVNLLGSIYTTQIVLPEMIKNNNGTIINILSVAAKTVFTNSSIYASSKAGLDYFAKVLREEVRSHHIRILNVFPGATSTEIWPKESLNKFSDKMMKPESLADLIFDVYKTDPSLSPEELVVRPITGDL